MKENVLWRHCSVYNYYNYYYYIYYYYYYYYYVALFMKPVFSFASLPVVSATSRRSTAAARARPDSRHLGGRVDPIGRPVVPK